MTIEPITIIVTSLEKPANALVNGITPKMPMARAEATAVTARGIFPVANKMIVMARIISAIVEGSKSFTPPVSILKRGEGCALRSCCYVHDTVFAPFCLFQKQLAIVKRFVNGFRSSASDGISSLEGSFAHTQKNEYVIRVCHKSIELLICWQTILCFFMSFVQWPATKIVDCVEL